MKIIMQCAASKRCGAGKLQTVSGESVLFVADPLCAPRGERCARPDDPCGDRPGTWRDLLTEYNEGSDEPYKLCQAAHLYLPKGHEYRDLYQEFARQYGPDFFILSAAWGLIRADYFTPDYNVTYSAQAKKKSPCAWRNYKDKRLPWLDFNHLEGAEILPDEQIHFFGGKDYLTPLYDLVETCPGSKTVHHKGSIEKRPGFRYDEYRGPEKNRTWHYRAAKDFLAKHLVSSAPLLARGDEHRMDETWEQIWAELRRGVDRLPRCSVHSDFPSIQTLHECRINDIVCVREDAIVVCSHSSQNVDKIPVRVFQKWWQHLNEHQTAALAAHHAPRGDRSALVGAIFVHCLPSHVEHTGDCIRLRRPAGSDPPNHSPS